MQLYNAQHGQYELFPVRIGIENKQIRNAIINCTNFDCCVTPVNSVISVRGFVQ
jgi:hypothetical protein